MNWYKQSQLNQIDPNDTIRLYRGMSQKFDEGFDLTRTDAPVSYSHWTDNPQLAREYAGKDGIVYEIDLPRSQLGTDIIDEEGERSLFFNNEKKAGLNNISGDEYLLYQDHDNYNPQLMRESR